jgi:valyl-tRNA synthetase
MRNIEPWCVSRQIWWGHQIPAWYGPDGRVFVEESEEAACEAARACYGEEAPLARDPDVLDTWFSSALWPFSTLGWPDETPELARYYPTDVLVTGFDIIFFWVARMIMMGLHFMKEVPFRRVYIHALVRDEKGQKMSKSKGNVIDPLALMDRYGADALRFTLAVLAVQGRDIKLAERRVEGYRNFATKLWNAARFCEMNDCRWQASFDPSRVAATVNRWIAGETARTAAEIERALDAFRFNEAANAVYHFVWGTFCDWYLEFIKPALAGAEGGLKAETRATCAWTLGQILHLLHPFMPYVTEELWGRFGFGPPLLIAAPWPRLGRELDSPEQAAEMNFVIRLISEVRSVRTQYNVPPSRQIAIGFRGLGAKTREIVAAHEEAIRRLAGLRLVEFDVSDLPARGTVQAVVNDAAFDIYVAEAIDLQSEQQRIKEEILRISREIEKIDAKLSNIDFLARAPEEIIAEQRERRSEALNARERLEEALDRLRL